MTAPLRRLSVEGILTLDSRHGEAVLIATDSRVVVQVPRPDIIYRSIRSKPSLRQTLRRLRFFGEVFRRVGLVLEVQSNGTTMFSAGDKSGWLRLLGIRHVRLSPRALLRLLVARRHRSTARNS